MKLTNEFEVNAPIADAWTTLTDVERIAPCLPGAQLQEVEGDEYRGIVKVKLGSITAQFKGTARITEQDDDAHHAVIEASGRGRQGQASAVITVKAEPVGERTKVNVFTDMSLSGRVAQFGRSGIMAEVSQKIITQFVENLGDVLEEDDDRGDSRDHEPDMVTAESTAAVSAQAAGVRKIDAPEPEALDLINAASGVVAKWFAPVAAAIAAIVARLRSFRRKAE
jgi:carbon monoxide dehydrogenase subunit G